MAITVAPGATFEAYLEKAPTGLTAPTIGYQIVDGVGGTTLARTTTGIIETPASSGSYAASGIVAPTTAGQYLIVWDWASGVLSSTTTASEELTVTSSQAAVGTPSGADLTTVAAVREYLQKPTGDTAQDAVIQRLITRASAAIREFTGRQFRPLDTVDQTRLVELRRWWRGRDVKVYDLSAAPTTVRILDEDASTVVATLTSSDYLALPLDRLTGWPIEALRILRSAGTLRPDHYLQVTGKWGWTTIPDDVELAAIVCASLWMRRDVQAFSTTYSIQEDRVERPEALPSTVKRLLTPYRRAEA